MIHPSYYELIDKINKEQGTEDSPVVTSRYSIVLAASKRARQLVNGAMPKIKDPGDGKLLSLAVEELYEGAVKIIPEGHESEDEEEKAGDSADMFTIDSETDTYDETPFGDETEAHDDTSEAASDDAAEEMTEN
jgi:DNA-directed RNA polymerase subunit omega